jgi:uncharacterized protein (UPF0262 family)
MFTCCLPSVTGANKNTLEINAEKEVKIHLVLVTNVLYIYIYIYVLFCISFVPKIVNPHSHKTEVDDMGRGDEKKENKETSLLHLRNYVEMISEHKS